MIESNSIEYDRDSVNCGKKVTARMRQQRQPGAYMTPYFPREFYNEIVREIDPDQSVTDDALVKFNQLADDFIRSVLRESLQLARSKENPMEKNVITPQDVHYILQSRFGMSLSGASGPVPSGVVQGPTDEYKEKLRTVREFASGRDD
jgi:histone H3/H4